jgi:hypothetical protein
MKKSFKGNFMREVVAETAILSCLIILPMAFLGPGWRMPQQKAFADAHRARIDSPGKAGGSEDD